MKYVIFDIDNCIADDAWRIPLIDWTPGLSPDERYSTYHAGCDKDQPGNAEVLTGYLYQTDVGVIFLTARPESLRWKTERWLFKHFGLQQPRLRMRPAGDHSPSVDLKAEMLNGVLTDIGVNDVIIAAFDDRPDIVAMYVRASIPAHILRVHDVCAYTPPGDEAPADQYPVQGARPPPALLTVPEILAACAETYRARNVIYGDNYKKFGPLLAALYPDGLHLRTAEDFARLGVFVQVLSKCSRYAENLHNGGHLDSAHDLITYAAMLQELTAPEPQKGQS